MRLKCEGLSLKGIFSVYLAAFLGIGGLLLGEAKAATFTVNSPTCASIQTAIANANANPGLDTVEFTVDVADVADVSCSVVSTADPDTMYIARVTDDLIIEGNGHSITGASRWIRVDGQVNVIGDCPSDSSLSIIVSNPLGLIRLDNAAKVTVNNLALEKLRSIAVLKAGADLTLNNVQAEKIYDFFGKCESSAITVLDRSDQNVTINNSLFNLAWNDGTFIGGRDRTQIWGNSFISGVSTTGRLTISNSTFRSLSVPVAHWDGTAQIEKSLIDNSGFLTTIGGSVSIVNSLLIDRPAALGQGFYNRVVASGGGSIQFEASTIAMGFLDCGVPCQATTGPGALIATTGGTIELKASAVGVLFPQIPGEVLIREATGGDVTATGSPNPNWVQPIPDQNSGVLRTLLNQPALLTESPGLTQYLPSIYPSIAVPLLDDGAGNPGLLINAVTAANTTNVLTSRIDGAPINEDFFGNPRTEAGGTVRNIGAVQLNLAPSLNLTTTGDGSADLDWTRPLDPGSGAITGYEACFGTGTAPDPSTIGTTCPGTVQGISNAPATLAGQVSGLTNGDTYWFLVRGINPASGPWSNVVSGTPMGIPGMPAATAVPGDGTASLTWTAPADGGSPIRYYLVRYRLVGATNWTLWPSVGTGTSANVGGLSNGSAYEFAVNAVTDAGSGPDGTANTTPQAPLFLQYPTPAQMSAGSSTLSLSPTFGNVVGTASYALTGSPPGWLSINASTGVVTATNPPSTGSDYTESVTVELTRSGPPAGSVTAGIDINVLEAGASPYLSYLNYTGTAGSATSITPTVFGLVAPYTFSNTNNNLPPGLTISNASTGAISGTPTTVGFWNVEMQVVDNGSAVRNDASAITIAPTLAYPTLSGTVGTPLSVMPVVPPIQSGESYSYALNGSLPPGLSFDTATGQISGTPTSAVSKAVDVTVMAALPTGTVNATTHLAAVINGYTIDFSYPAQSAAVGTAFSLIPAVTGTIGTVSYSIDGALPSGVTLNPNTGEISGTMTSALAGQALRISLTDDYSTRYASASLEQLAIAPAVSVPLLAPHLLLLLCFGLLGTSIYALRKYAEA